MVNSSAIKNSIGLTLPGAVAVVVGAVTITGWTLGAAQIVGLLVGARPIIVTSAVGLLLVGCALLAIAFRAPTLLRVLLALPVALLAGIELWEDLAAKDFGFEELLVHPSLREMFPASMPPNTAICLLLLSLALLMLSGSLGRRRKPLVAVLGAGICAISALGLIGYLAGIPAAHTWGRFSSMPVVTSLTFLLLGSGLVYHAWHLTVQTGSEIPEWFPVLATVTALLMVISLWQALQRQSYLRIAQLCQISAAAVSSEVDEDIQRRLRELVRIARWSDQSKTLQGVPEYEISVFHNTRNIQWVDKDLRVRSAVPEARNLQIVGTDLHHYPGRKELLAEAIRVDGPAMSKPIDLVGGGRGFLFAVPVFHDGKLDGYLSAADEYKSIFDAILGDLHSGYAVQVFDGSELISSRGVAAPGTQSLISNRQVDFPGTSWTIRIAPTLALIADSRRAINHMVLVVGSVMAVLIGFSLHLLRYGQQQARELQTARDRAEFAIRGSSDGIWDWDLRTDEVFYSPQWKAMLGYKDEDIGDSVHDFYSKIHPDDMGRVCDAIEEHLRGERPQLWTECRLRQKDGSYRWILDRAIAARDAHGVPYRLAGSHVDIQERVEAQRALTEKARELERSNTELQQFAYVASHDLQEPLRMVASFSQLLKERYADKLDDRANKYITFAVEGAQRMQRLINDLLSLSRVHTRGEEFHPVDCRKVVEEARKLLRRQIAESGATFVIADLPTVVGDGSQLVQLFQNLFSNAMKFRGDAPPLITVTASNEGGSWIFTVTDNGIGIDPKQADRIFVIFQRLHTREQYPGTGIGLAIAKKIVERAGGNIWLVPKPPPGSTFKFSIPVGPDSLSENSHDAEEQLAAY